MTEQDYKKLGDAIGKELEASKMCGAAKEALTERIISKVKESDAKGIRGLDMLNSKGGRLEITLGNGLRINADALI